MAIAYKSQTLTSLVTGGTNRTVSPPAGLSDDDIMIAVGTTSNTTAPTPTAPSGWTRIGTELAYTYTGWNVKLGAWWKRASDEKGVSYTWTFSTADNQFLIKSYSGCIYNATPVGTPSENSGNSQTTTYTTVTTGSNNSWIIAVGVDWTWAGGLTAPSGMTERADASMYTADELRATAGATGNRTHTNSNASAAEPFLAYLFELIVNPDWPPGGTSDAAQKLRLQTTGQRW